MVSSRKSADLFFETKIGEDGIKVIARNAIVLNEWQHFAATMDSMGAVKLYKNGALVKEGKTGVPDVITRTKNYLGESSWGPETDALYEGMMDEVRVYERVLSAEEIKALAEAVPPAK
jgi:hypothetical protein